MKILKDLMKMIFGFGPEEPEAVSAILLTLTILALAIVLVAKLT
jgi:hypothetical protein